MVYHALADRHRSGHLGRPRMAAITPPDIITQEFRTPAATRRGVIAGVVGNMLEWYDFARR